jgi:hypothetical protein
MPTVHRPEVNLAIWHRDPPAALTPKSLRRLMQTAPFTAVAEGSPIAVAILKGEAYPGNAGAGCIHRSPPAGPGRRARLLLCIDQTKWNPRE